MRLLSAADHRLVTQFQLAIHRHASGLASGEQRSPALGGGIEFADYREYHPGDDVRQIDWAVFLRFHKLLVKLAAEEKDLTLMILLDNSRSMNYGKPDKFRRACQIAAVLAGIALESGNSAGIATWGDELRESIRPLRGSRNLSWVCHSLENLPLVTSVNAAHCVRQFANHYGRNCLTVMISDFLFPDWEAAMAGLGHGPSDTHIIQILAPAELQPGQQGEVCLVDMENAQETPLHIDLATLNAYQRELSAHQVAIRNQCRQRGIFHHQISSANELIQVFQNHLLPGGLVC